MNIKNITVLRAGGTASAETKVIPDDTVEHLIKLVAPQLALPENGTYQLLGADSCPITGNVYKAVNAGDTVKITPIGLRDVAIYRLERGKLREQQVKAIQSLIDVDYNWRRIISETINPYFAAVMRPYSDFLYEQTRTVAYFLSEITGHHDELANDYWLGAQKYVASLAASAGTLSSSADMNFEQHFRMLQEAVPLQNYFGRVSELAQVMSRNAGPDYTNAVDFWVAAETHIIAIGAKSIANAKNVFDAIESLRKAFSKFEAVTYLASIQESAYYIWKALGKPPGHALNDWLKAEARALALER